MRDVDFRQAPTIPTHLREHFAFLRAKGIEHGSDAVLFAVRYHDELSDRYHRMGDLAEANPDGSGRYVLNGISSDEFYRRAELHGEFSLSLAWGSRYGVI